MKKLALVLLALPLAGCVVPQWERQVESKCSAQAAGQTGYGRPGGNNSYGAFRYYATDYYTCLDQTRAAVVNSGYGGYGYAYGYGYPYSSSYPYSYYPYAYGPSVGVGVGFRGR